MHSRRKESQPRQTAGSQYNTSRWQKARAAFKREHPFCQECEKEGRYAVLAAVIDHIVPHKGDMRLFWDEGNWQALCKTHHDQKTAREDGGFGNQIRRER